MRQEGGEVKRRVSWGIDVDGGSLDRITGETASAYGGDRLQKEKRDPSLDPLIGEKPRLESGGGD